MHAQRPGIDSLPFEQGGVMGRIRTAVSAVTVLTCVVLAAAGVVGAAPVPNVDVSQRHLNESEESIAVNPTNPNNIVIVTNIGHREAGITSGMFEAVTFDGGQTWQTSIIGQDPDASTGLGDTCCDPSLSFDSYGNLFFTYLYETENLLPIALSTDG